MRTIKLFTIVLLLSSMIGQAQEEQSSKWKIASIELVPIAFGTYGNEFAGNLNVSIIFNKDKHYLKTTALFGSEFGIGLTGRPITDDYNSLEMLYGRKFQLGDKSTLMTFIGGSYFSGEVNQVRENGFGVPIHASFEFGRKFVIGPQLYGNINGIGSVFSVGLLLKWNFK